MSEPLSDLAFDREGMERAGGLVMEYKYETRDGVTRRRLYAIDPGCEQLSAYCPCGPVGEWEVVAANESEVEP